MIVEGYRCIIDEGFVKFKESLHDALYQASHDEDVTDIDLELLRMHVIDLQESLDGVIDG